MPSLRVVLLVATTSPVHLLAAPYAARAPLARIVPCRRAALVCAASGTLSRPTIPDTTPAPVKKELTYDDAVVLQQTRRHRAALDLLEELSVRTPEDGRVWMRIMRAHKQAGRRSMAEAAIKSGIEACPANARLRQALADLCREGGRHDEARLHFRQAMTLDRELVSIYDSWGRMEAALGQHSLAASLFKRGLAIEPRARLHHALGVLLDKVGETEAARVTLRAGLDLSDEQHNPQLLHALGMLEGNAGDVGRARAHFMAAIEHHPTFTLAHLSLGRLEESLGRLQAARRQYAAGATTPQPGGGLGPPQLWHSWASAELALGRAASARRIYGRASRLYPRDAPLLIEWARLTAAADHGEEAREIFARALNLPEPSAYAHQCAAALEQKLGDIDAARSLFERGAALPDEGRDARGRAPGKVALLNAWAVFEWKQGREIFARELFGRAEGLAPAPCSWLFQWRARFEAEHANYALSRHYYARAVNAAPRESSAWRLWGELEAEHGEAARSATYLARSAELQALAAFVDVPQGRRNSRRWRSGRVPRRSAPGPQPAWED